MARDVHDRGFKVELKLLRLLLRSSRSPWTLSALLLLCILGVCVLDRSHLPWAGVVDRTALLAPGRASGSEQMCPGAAWSLQNPNSIFCHRRVLEDVEARCNGTEARGRCCERTAMINAVDPKISRWLSENGIGTPAPGRAAPSLLPHVRQRTWGINTSFGEGGARVRLVDPRGVYLIEGFLTPREADIIVEENRDYFDYVRMGPNPSDESAWGFCCARTYARRALAFSEVDATSRNSHVLSAIQRKTELLTRVPPRYYELIQISKYMPGQLLSGHWDAAFPGWECMEGRKVRERCDDPSLWRMITLITYLNDQGQDGDGGATYFPLLDLKLRPAKGSTIVFFPTLLDGNMHADMFHAIEEARSTKLVMQQWIRMPYHPGRLQARMDDPDLPSILDAAMRSEGWPLQNWKLKMDF